MTEIASFFSLIQLVDAVIAFTMVEGGVLLAFHHMTGRGIAPRDYVLNLLSGLCLMFSLRCALTNASWPWIAIWVSAAGVAHVADIAQRWLRQRRRFQAG